MAGTGSATCHDISALVRSFLRGAFDKVAGVDRVAERAVVVLAACAAALLGWRALEGPYRLGNIWVRSPLTLETVFTLLAGALLAAACLRGRNARTALEDWPARVLLPIALAMTALAFLPNIGDPFVSDDYILTSRFYLTFDRVRDFAIAGGDGAFRPVGNIGYALIHTLAGARPLTWHCSILTLHLLNCALLFAVARTLWGNGLLPFTAALLFGLHGSRPQAVAWTSDLFDMLACALSLAGVLLLFRAPWKRVWAQVAIALVLLAAAILCKESAYAMPVFVFCFAAAAGRLGERPIRAFLVSSVVLCVAMFVWRWSLFHGPGGYLDPVTGRPAILSLHIITTVKALCVRLWTILLFPLNWTSPTGVWVAAGLAAGCAAILFVLWNSGGVRPRTVLWMIAATLCAMAPALHLAMVDESSLGSRILYIPALPFFVLAGHVVASVASRRRAIVGLAALMFGTVVFLEHNLAFWHRTALAADQVCSDAAAGKPVQVRSAELPGILSFGNGLKECVEMKRQQAAGR